MLLAHAGDDVANKPATLVIFFRIINMILGSDLAKTRREEFEADFGVVMDRLEKVRCKSITPPEWCFWLAQRKVKSGDYTFDVDEPKQSIADPAGK